MMQLLLQLLLTLRTDLPPSITSNHHHRVKLQQNKNNSPPLIPPVPFLKHLFSPSYSSPNDRKFNIIIFGVKECDIGTPRHECSRLDSENASVLLSDLVPTISPLSIRDIIHLGKLSSSNDKLHPLLVKLI